jgi:hypothetical protein
MGGRHGVYSFLAQHYYDEQRRAIYRREWQKAFGSQNLEGKDHSGEAEVDERRATWILKR